MATKTLTNDEAQAKFEACIIKLRNSPYSLRNEMAISILLYIKLFSEANGTIPALRGIGLEDAIAFVDELEANPDAKITISSKALASALRIAPPE